MIVLRNKKIRMGEPEDVAKIFQDLLCLEDKIDRDREHLYVMHLNSHYQLKLVELVVIGTMTEAMVHSREVFRRAVIEGSAAIALGHNHPLGEVLGIPLLDHIVFSATDFYSIQKECEL
jgi:DNA repair protein RadC